MSKSFLVLAVSAILTAACGIGCNKSSEGGVAGSNNSFKVSAPTMAVSIKQGDKQTVSLTLDRGSDFKQTVKLDAQAPKGLSVSFDKSTVKAGDAKEVAMSISADKEAAIGEHVIKVTAKPETGNETNVDVKVTVAK